jgi:hypothetical protein
MTIIVIVTMTQSEVNHGNLDGGSGESQVQRVDAIHASSPRSVTLTQLRFTSLAVVSSRADLHLQECARAGRPNRKGPVVPGIFTYI